MSVSGIEAQIADALYYHLGQLVLSPVLPVVWPGTEYAGTGAHLSASLFPTETSQITFGSDGLNRHEGLFQVSVFWPEGQGELSARSVAGAVIAHFKRGTSISRSGRIVQINTPPRAGGALPEPGWLQIPVTVRWHCDAPNP